MVAKATGTSIERCLRSSTAGARNAHSCQRTIGSASSSPAQRLTMIEVANGSIGLSVTGLSRLAGSGALSQWRMRP